MTSRERGARDEVWFKGANVGQWDTGKVGLLRKAAARSLPDWFRVLFAFLIVLSLTTPFKRAYKHYLGLT